MPHDAGIITVGIITPFLLSRPTKNQFYEDKEEALLEVAECVSTKKGRINLNRAGGWKERRKRSELVSRRVMCARNDHRGEIGLPGRPVEICMRNELAG